VLRFLQHLLQVAGRREQDVDVGLVEQPPGRLPAERYTPAQGASAIAPMKAGRLEHSAVLLRGPLAGKVLLVGRWREGWYNPAVSVYE
jgi:hypothetical protein